MLVKGIIGIILLFGGGSVFALVQRTRPVSAPSLPPAQRYQVQPTQNPTSTRPNPAQVIPTSTAPSPTATALPASLRLDVPFISQAPKQNWDMPYQEACEEASILMVDAYYSNEETNPSADVADKRILDLIKWEADTYGAVQVDTGAAQTGEIAQAYFDGIKAEAVPFKNADQIKQYLAQGYPVIVPVDGKTIPNPNFRNGGPVYHMLVVKGYTADGKWITNDPGTRKGESFLYAERDLINSIRDWNGGSVPEAKPMLLVLKPKK